MFGVLLYVIFFFLIPIALIALFTIVLCRYIFAKKQNKVAPNTFSDAEIKKRKIVLIVVAVISAVLVLTVIAFISLMFMAVAFM